MKVDTIQKVKNKKNNAINLRKDKIFKISFLDIIKGSITDKMFYFLVVFCMVIIVVFWGVRFKKTFNNETTNQKREERVEELSGLLDDLSYVLKDAFSNIKEESNQTKEELERMQNEENAEFIVNSLSEQQKDELKKMIEQKSVPDEFYQEELKVRLEMLENNK